MAYQTTSDTILITATLTDKGKKLLSRGKFKVAKFALGDDEIDYELFKGETAEDLTYFPALLNTEIMEAFKDKNKNLQFGLNSFDAGILYLTKEELDSFEAEGKALHALIEYLPILVKNTKTLYSPTIRENKYYLSVNDETTKIVNDELPNFNFLQANNFDTTKIIIESGIFVFDADTVPLPTLQNREDLIVKKFLLDNDLLIQADNRLISNIVSMDPSSKFENFNSGEKIVNFKTGLQLTPISLESEFEYFATYPMRTIPNLVADYDITTEETVSTNISNLNGPRGTVAAFNPIVDNELKVNSGGTRDSRFSIFGTTESTLFSELPNRKFDYIDTTIYVMGVTSNARLQIPIRIVRYAGT
tara:strand:+ start:2392 stop:3474 length:1083 start_codon:yes stop_codon:yes gene_type:complete